MDGGWWTAGDERRQHSSGSSAQRLCSSSVNAIEMRGYFAVPAAPLFSPPPHQCHHHLHHLAYTIHLHPPRHPRHTDQRPPRPPLLHPLHIMGTQHIATAQHSRTHRRSGQLISPARCHLLAQSLSASRERSSHSSRSMVIPFPSPLLLVDIARLLHVISPLAPLYCAAPPSCPPSRL